jgi:hypothetical protein
MAQRKFVKKISNAFRVQKCEILAAFTNFLKNRTALGEACAARAHILSPSVSGIVNENHQIFANT